MAGPDDPRTGAVALQRFGLGPRPGQGEAMRREARDRLLAELEKGGAPQPPGAPFPGVTEIGRALFAFEDQQKIEREAKRAAMPTGPENPQGMQVAGVAPMAGPDRPGAEARPASQNETARAARPRPDEPALPFRTYRDEVKARVDLALAAETGFGERLTMFWSNHFCIGATKSNIGRIMAGVYEREAIRPHVFGRFEDMLIAAESHPAMLDFLDNRQSIGPNSPAGRRRGRGLNENLAREIMELHTLGISGGYSQGDVTNLARILTGWTMAGRDGRLDRPGGEEHPAVLGAARPVARGGREPGLREGVGEIGADGGAFGDDRRAMDQGRDLAHRVDRLVGRPLHRLAEADDLGTVGLAELLHHPAGDAAARHRVGVEHEFVGHGVSFRDGLVSILRPWRADVRSASPDACASTCYRPGEAGRGAWTNHSRQRACPSAADA